MRYLLCAVCVCFCCVNNASPPARAASRPLASHPERPGEIVAADLNDPALATLREDYLHSAARLYHAASAPPGNVVVAPHTTLTALAMLYAGARGASATQLAEALRWRLAPEALGSAHAPLQAALLHNATNDTNTLLTLASRLWLDSRADVVVAYQERTARTLGASAGVVDFAHHPSDARDTINAWVAEQTRHLIPNLLGPQAVDVSTMLVQTSAMYLKANWQFPFDLARGPAPFYNADGTSTSVPMLDGAAGATYHYAQTEAYQAVEIFYEGRALAMDIIVPDPKHMPFADFVQGWDAPAMQHLAQSFAPREVTLHMPKFAVQSTQDLLAALSALGVHDMFDPEQADLRAMVQGAGVFVGAALSQAKIAVDENGTEAAAATAIVLAPASAEPGEPVELSVDRPFLFVVRDVAQNVVLLMGHVSHF